VQRLVGTQRSVMRIIHCSRSLRATLAVAYCAPQHKPCARKGVGGSELAHRARLDGGARSFAGESELIS
jgi:hypothetical protein